MVWILKCFSIVSFSRFWQFRAICPIFPQLWHLAFLNLHLLRKWLPPQLKHSWPFLRPISSNLSRFSCTLFNPSIFSNPDDPSMLKTFFSALSIADAIFNALSKLNSVSANKRCWIFGLLTPQTNLSLIISSKVTSKSQCSDKRLSSVT